MSAAPANRCYRCGRPVLPEDTSCDDCGAMQTALCESCGATFSVYRDACPGCGFAHDAFEYRPRLTPGRVALLVLLVLAAAGAVLGYRWLRHDPGRDARNDFARAAAFYDKGDYAAATKAFGAWLDAHGENAKAFSMLALARWRSGEEAAAVRAAERALEIAPGYAPAAAFLADRALAAGDAGRALALARQALAAPKPPAEAHLVAGLVLARADHLDLAGAVRHLKAAVEGGVGDPPALRLLARLADAKRRARPGSESDLEIEAWLERARARVEERLSVEARDADALFLLARIQAALEDRSGAIMSLTLSLEHGEKTPGKRVLLGKLRWLQHDRERARAVFDEVLAAAPGPEIRLEIGRFLEEQGETDAAAKVLADAIAAFPGDVALRVERARVDLGAGRLAAAEAGLRDALGKRPDAPDLVLLLVRTLATAGKRSEAIERIAAAAERAGSGSLAALWLADLLLDTPRDAPEHAARIARAAAVLDADPEAGAEDELSLVRQYLRGKLDLVRGRYGSAIEKLSPVAGSLPGDAITRLMLAQAHAARGEDGLASMEATAVKRLVGAAPQLPAPEDGPAAAAARLVDAGETAAAAAAAREALAAHPESLAARVVLFETHFDADGLPAAARAAAERLHDEVAQLAPGSPEERYLAGKLALADGDAPAAAAILGVPARECSANPRYRYAYGAALLLAGRADEAKVELAAARDLAGGGSAADLLAAASAPPVPETAAGLFRCAVADPAHAEALYRRVLALDPKHAAAANNLADLLAARGSAEAAAEAVGLADRAVAAAPDRAAFRDTLGFARLAAGDAEGAVEAFDRALALAEAATPPDAAAVARTLVRRALARVAAKDRPGARRDLDAAAGRDPSVTDEPEYRRAANLLDR